MAILPKGDPFKQFIPDKKSKLPPIVERNLPSVTRKVRNIATEAGKRIVNDFANTPPLPEPGQETPGIEDIIRGLLDDERFRARRQVELNDIESRRNANIKTGQDYIKNFALGRMNQPLTGENDQLRSLLQGRLGGLAAGENAAMREQAFRGLNQQRQGDLRELRALQGQQGIRGPAAAAQNQLVMREAADRGSDLEQQLLIENIAQRRQAAQDFAAEINRQQAQNLGIQQANLLQSNRESEIRNAFPFLFAGLGAAEQSTATANISSRDQLLATLLPELLSGQIVTQQNPTGAVSTPPLIPYNQASAPLPSTTAQSIRRKF